MFSCHFINSVFNNSVLFNRVNCFFLSNVADLWTVQAKSLNQPSHSDNFWL